MLVSASLRRFQAEWLSRASYFQRENVCLAAIGAGHGRHNFRYSTCSPNHSGRCGIAEKNTDLAVMPVY
jgi:hypothetical protein